MIAMLSTPIPPQPCTARAASSWGIDCASPHIAEPTTNNPRANSNTRLRPWASPILP